MTTPQQAALDALRNYLQAGLTEVRVLEGWPESDVNLSGGPVLAVLEGGKVQWSNITPELLSELSTPYLYRTAIGTLSVQCTLMTAYSAQREDTAAVLELLLDNQFPLTTGLMPATNYHAQMVRFEVQSASSQDNAGQLLGEWTQTWLLSASVALIREAPYATLLTTETAVSAE